MMSAPLRLLVRLPCLAACLPACDFSERAQGALQIVEPENEATFRDAEDVNRMAQGMQIDVRVESDGEGHKIELSRRRGDTPESLAFASVTQGVAHFRSVTLLPGVNRLSARDTATGRNSLPLTVYYADSCGEITFIEPAIAPDAKELVLGPKDDRDESPCGDAYAIRVIAATGLPDDTQVSLLAGQMVVASGATRGGVLVLDPVALEPVLNLLSEPTFGLSLRVEGGACSGVQFPVPLRVDCEGPERCTIDSLADGQLLTSQDDLSSTPGLQLDVSVTTSDDARGKRVLLIIDDDTGHPLEGVARRGPESPVAIFRNVALPEGNVRLDAVCEDGVGNLRPSVRRNLIVDSLGCAIAITSPTLDTVLSPTPPDTSATVTVTATISGGDCADVFVAVREDERCDALFTTEPEALVVGQTSLSREVTVETPGANALCVGVVDRNGNTSFASVRVVLDTGSP